ncbi:hypothetical protein CFR77_07625 [Komagataeibacter sucrofermentans]|uniref:Uncharacterized protein n=1 Tax=Komagataeibacter sucrofermentans TaxID=1053551 RepID=A0A318R117_9PROT|nr:hypothetical protein CFR77_07625 [Komagataeibacter sucrofermentans]GBQ43727.1 hypothetical protein AA15973_0084 [Komagataeibacter sucrofermentans DSM 15973]
MKPARRGHDNTGTGPAAGLRHEAGAQKDGWAKGLISAFVGLPAAKVKAKAPLTRRPCSSIAFVVW